MTLEDSARRAGAHVWVERQLFEIAGSWVRSTPVAEVKLLLDRHAQHHAWRSGQWWERLPVLADVDRNALVAEPGPAVAEALKRLAAMEETVGRLAGLYRVALPRLWSGYDVHRRLADPVADGPSLRTLGIVIADVAADWCEGESALQGLLTDERSVAVAAEVVARLEKVLVPGVLKE